LKKSPEKLFHEVFNTIKPPFAVFALLKKKKRTKLLSFSGAYLTVYYNKALYTLSYLYTISKSVFFISIK